MYQTKGNNPPRIDFFEWMIYVLFAGTSFLIGLVVYGIGKSFAWPVRRLMDQVRGEKVATEEKTEEKAKVAPMAVPEINSAKAPVVDWDVPEIVAAEIRRIELKKGYVVFRFYEQSGTAKGKLTVTARALHKAIGKTVLLNLNQCKTLVDATNVMRAKAETILASAAVTKTDASKGVKASSVQEFSAAGIPDSMEMPFMDEMPFADMISEIPPYFTDGDFVPMEPDMGDPYEQFAAPEATKEASRPMRKMPDTAPKVEVKYRGILVGYGSEERKLDDPKKGERLVNHFCVRIHDEDLHTEQPLWGNDLQRVIKEANVQVGDRIELGVVGETPVMVRGKPRKKKVWTLTKV